MMNNNDINILELIKDSTQDINRNNSDLISLLAINELINNQNVKRISRITPEQVNILTKLYLFGSIFDSNIATAIADNILNLQISIKGLGRKELVQLVQVRNEGRADELQFKTRDIFR